MHSLRVKTTLAVVNRQKHQLYFLVVQPEVFEVGSQQHDVFDVPATYRNTLSTPLALQRCGCVYEPVDEPADEMLGL